MLLVPVAYLICLKFLGEHSIITEIAGFVLLSLSALVAKLTTTGVIDPVLFTAVAVFFTAGVFKVRVQFSKGHACKGSLWSIYVGFAIAAYRLMHMPVLVLLPLIDNLVFSITLYRLKLRRDRMAGSAQRGCIFIVDGPELSLTGLISEYSKYIFYRYSTCP